MEDRKSFVIKSLVSLGICGGLVGGTLAYVYNVGFNSPTMYSDTAKVVYDAKEYFLKDLYKLTSEEETHVCRKESRSSTKLQYCITPEGKFGYMYTLSSDPSIYIDIETDQEIAIEGYESLFGYSVEKLIDYFPYEEYGSEYIVYIYKDQVDEKIKPKVKTM